MDITQTYKGLNPQVFIQTKPGNCALIRKSSFSCTKCQLQDADLCLYFQCHAPCARYKLVFQHLNEFKCFDPHH